jgi:hypothetical protein
MTTNAETKQMIKEAVMEAMKEGSCVVSCPLSVDAQKEVTHFFGMVKDIGCGDTRKGVENMRDVLKFVPSLMRVRNNIGNIVLGVVVTSLAAGVLAAIWRYLTDALSGR